MKKLFLPLFLFLSLLLLFVTNRPQHTAQAQSTTIAIKNYAFSPQTITIKSGSSVTWRNDDNAAHTATSDTGAWNSPTLNKGQTYTRTFSTPGTYTYHCALHANMTGTIIVTAVTPTTVSSPTPTPPQAISPTFACLGACPTPTPSPDPNAPTPTKKPDIVTPSPQNPCAVANIEPANDLHAMHNKGGNRGNKGGNRGYKGGYQGGGGGSQYAAPSNSNNGFLQFFLTLLQMLLQLLGLGNGPVPQPKPSPTPPPANVPTITSEPASTGGLSPTPCPATPTPTGEIASPTPTGSISIDDLKYVQGTEALRKFDLIAEPLNGSSTVWTFNSDLSQNKTPGPEWRVVQGDHMRINFVNKLPEATAIHWHGVRVFASQDGIPGITQNSVPPGGSYQYDFIVPDAGTYWYHPHQNSQQQVPKGLMGAIIVEPRIPTGDTFQRDHTIAYSNNVPNPGTTQLQAQPGERVRLRLINGRESDFSGTLLRVALVGAPFKVISLDGQAINEPQQISSQLIELAMGNRADLEFIMPSTGSVKLLESENLQNFTIGQGTEPSIPNLNTLPVFSFLNYGVPKDDPRRPQTTFDAEYTLNLGADLSINGKLFPNVPDIVVKKGQFTKITYVNNSNLIHPMHLHGQFYSVLKVNGVPVTGSPIHRDTVVVKPGETVEVSVRADNEGIWMLHCHVLQHAAGGMMMLNAYDNVYTPYKHGSGTHNDPH